jgi:predicted phage terminase large subunit-like protein
MMLHKKIDPEQIDYLEAQRILCARSFSHFVKRAWPHIIPDALVWNWHMDAICEHMQALHAGQIPSNRLLINVPPGSSKSTLVGVMYSAWLWGPAGEPWHRYIGAAHEQGLAVRDNRLTRELVQSEWYQKLWPLSLKGDQNEKLYFENEARGFRQACAVASMTGRRGHTIGLDDPLSPEKAHSDAGRETAIRVLSETIPTRLNNPAKSAIVIVMQRLHERDPSGYVLSEGLGYEHLLIPMEFEPERRVHTCIGWTDPRAEAGELMFPDRFPQHVIDRDKKALGAYGWAGQMQQRPNPSGGGLFKSDWWQYLDMPPPMEWRAIYADTAQKTGQQNDYTVFQCWGKGKDGRAVLLDMVRGKFEAPELLERARAFWAKHGAIQGQGPLRAFKVEDKSSGTGLIQQLKRQGGIPVIGIPRDKDKLTRAYDAAPYIESGNVVLLRSAPGLSDLLAEAEAFPNGAHDDTLDPMMDAIGDMLAGRKSSPSIRTL